MVSGLVLPPCEVEVTFERGGTGALGDSGCGTFSRLIIMGNVAGRAAPVSWSPATKALERAGAVVASRHQVAVASVRVGRQDLPRPTQPASRSTAPSSAQHPRSLITASLPTIQTVLTIIFVGCILERCWTLP